MLDAKSSTFKIIKEYESIRKRPLKAIHGIYKFFEKEPKKKKKLGDACLFKIKEKKMMKLSIPPHMFKMW